MNRLAQDCEPAIDSMYTSTGTYSTLVYRKQSEQAWYLVWHDPDSNVKSGSILRVSWVSFFSLFFATMRNSTARHP